MQWNGEKQAISTRKLLRFHLLFWSTDHRNLVDNNPTALKNEKLNNHDTSSLNRLPIKVRYSMEKVHDSPHIYIINNFMTQSELLRCEDIIATSKFCKSFVDDTVNNTDMMDEEQRTSTFVSIQKQADAKIASLERKAADLLGVCTNQLEPLQLVRYSQDQFFNVHHDLGDLLEDGKVELPPRQSITKRRIATLFCYLNDVESGGCTYFPACGDLRIQPKRGQAVLFCNILKQGEADPLTIHAGEQVKGKDNIKYGLNIWICEE